MVVVQMGWGWWGGNAVAKQYPINHTEIHTNSIYERRNSVMQCKSDSPNFYIPTSLTPLKINVKKTVSKWVMKLAIQVFW